MAKAATPKLDLKRELKEFYKPSARAISVVDVPPISFLMVDGKGDPGSQIFQDAIGALYAVAYTTKFALKGAAESPDFTIMPLEALWWSDDMDDFVAGNKENWLWTAMIAMPDFVTATNVEAARSEASSKKKAPMIDLLRFEQFHEGKAAQIMYVGPFADEGPTIASIHRLIKDEGYELSGLHHEIYLSDPRRTDPKKLKTIIRQPFK